MATPTEPENNLVPEPVEPDNEVTTDDDPTTEPETGTEPEGGGGEPEGDQPTPETPGVDWKAMARKWEKRAKENARKAAENAEARRRLDEASETEKTELDRLREAIASLQEENSNNKLKALRAEVSSRTGVPVELLTASTEEELNDQAEAISAFVASRAPAPKPAANGGKPKERLRSGAATTSNEPSREDILAAVMGKGRRPRAGGSK